MEVLEVRIINNAPETGHKLYYLIKVKSGVIRRCFAYFKDGVLSRDNDNKELTNLVKKKAKAFDFRRELNTLREI